MSKCFKIAAIVMLIFSTNLNAKTYLEFDALSRLKTQLNKLEPKIRLAHEASNHSTLQTNYSQILSDRKKWEVLINGYLIGEIKPINIGDLYESSYSKYKRIGKKTSPKSLGTSLNERGQLETIRNLILRMEPLIREAELSADPNAKMFLKYQVLRDDHSRWLVQLDEHLSKPFQPNDFQMADGFTDAYTNKGQRK